MISVVITTYGGDEWVRLAYERAVPSVEAQTERPCELVVHHEPTMEIGPARNAAAARATCEWLLFLDADDELDPGYLAAMHHTIRETDEPQPLLQPAVIYQVKNRRSMRPPHLIPPGDLRRDNFLVIGTVLRRDLFMQVGGFEDYPHGFEDWSLWAKCWKAGANVVQVPGAVYRAWSNPRSKHKLLWRNKRVQVEMHNQIAAELFPGGIDAWAR